MADDDLLDQLRAIAREEGISLGAVVREALEWRARLRHRPPSFIGQAETHDGITDTSERVDELIDEYVRAKHSGY